MTHTSKDQQERLRANLIDALYSSTENVTLSEEECQHLGKIISNQHARILELEASQAQRVPLGDAQAWEVINATHNLEHFDPYEHNALFELVRATEAAHGITQEKQG